jgi:hypothetical protein
MNFIEQTVNWCTGEIFEGKMIVLFGIAVIIISIAFWKAGTTPFARAIVVPLLVVGLLSATAGVVMVINNNKRIIEYKAAYQDDPTAFIQSEKERTDNFIKWYPYTQYVMSVIIIGGVGCYVFWGGAWGRAIGLALILLGLSVLFIDHFSEERAETYHQHIITALK